MIDEDKGLFNNTDIDFLLDEHENSTETTKSEPVDSSFVPTSGNVDYKFDQDTLFNAQDPLKIDKIDLIQKVDYADGKPFRTKYRGRLING